MSLPEGVFIMGNIMDAPGNQFYDTFTRPAGATGKFA
jgi:hypothetical protein